VKQYSTNHPDKLYDLSFAVLHGLAPDGGLFMPQAIPVLSNEFWQSFYSKSFVDICYHIAHEFLSPDVPDIQIAEIINKAITFPAPLVALDTQISILELFHGPSLAFKDFGAQFMAQLMAYFNRNADRELLILVATSGDTGGAVAAGFHNVPGIKVVILYPKDKVSTLQEKQLTTFGGNIFALEIDGTFDDCQSLVKQAFQDNSLTNRIRLSSANSINISRLIP
jgi:threonine synthase